LNLNRLARRWKRCTGTFWRRKESQAPSPRSVEGLRFWPPPGVPSLMFFQGHALTQPYAHRERARTRTRASRSSGLLARLRRSSVAPTAWSREGRLEGLRPRRWHAGGLPPNRQSRTGRRLPGVAPLDVFRGAMGCVSARLWKNVKDGTPGERHTPALSGTVLLPASRGGCERTSTAPAP
jgi:hypothetical protein